ncbi:MAG: MBL fold metallo-hydrolase [Alphaproteobacteria bacterium]|nr:MBL fold metallo-hydrolase [Alphaproteobacteria bacterium]
MSDEVIARAFEQARGAIRGEAARPVVKWFFDEETFTASYVVSDPSTSRAAIIDSVLNFDQPSGRTSRASADDMIAYVRDMGLSVEWILETHAHADHLSAAPYLQARLGGRIAIGSHISAVQSVFAEVFNEDEAFRRDGSQFDHLFSDGERFSMGSLPAMAIFVPGHTPADMAYLIGDALFVGDTMFMPDYGTARADFPGGDAARLYRSIRRLMFLPDETRVFLCHDYKAPGREAFIVETTIGDQRTSNIHVREGITEEAFVTMRRTRDASLGMPRLLLPSIQVNIRAGRMPEPESDGFSYLKLPIDRL